jgi:hypothetical protein
VIAEGTVFPGQKHREPCSQDCQQARTSNTRNSVFRATNIFHLCNPASWYEKYASNVSTYLILYEVRHKKTHHCISLSFICLFPDFPYNYDLQNLLCHSPCTLCHSPCTLCHSPCTLCRGRSSLLYFTKVSVLIVYIYCAQVLHSTWNRILL